MRKAKRSYDGNRLEVKVTFVTDYERRALWFGIFVSETFTVNTEIKGNIGRPLYIKKSILHVHFHYYKVNEFYYNEVKVKVKVNEFYINEVKVKVK